jgi:chromosome transmission fidelity protein 4
MLGYMILDMDRNSQIIANGALPLTSDSILSWFGFDCDTNLLCSVDSYGVLAVLSRAHANSWIPVLDMKSKDHCKTYEHEHWIVSLMNSTVMCVVLRNGEKYPQIIPRPLLSAVPFKFPLLMSAAGDSKDIEEAMVRKSFFLQLTKHDVEEGNTDKVCRETLAILGKRINFNFFFTLSLLLGCFDRR